jgi:hypothetical protein
LQTDLLSFKMCQSPIVIVTVSPKTHWRPNSAIGRHIGSTDGDAGFMPWPRSRSHVSGTIVQDAYGRKRLDPSTLSWRCTLRQNMWHRHIAHPFISFTCFNHPVFSFHVSISGFGKFHASTSLLDPYKESISESLQTDSATNPYP